LHHITDFYRYNSHVRKRYLDAIEKLPWKDVIKDRGASFGSIGNVFLHVLNAYRYWLLYAVKDNLKAYRGIDVQSCKSVDDMRTHEIEVDAMINLFLENLHEEDLSKVHTIHTESATYNVTLEAILMHMVEEELQHRGEINCMFWQQNIEPPIIEYGQWLGQWVEL
jgi:uncharacterized damage-inducible protein DinB